MPIVMTLCVKDEEDILDAQLAFHLNRGVDFVIVTDTGSTDGTLDILERYRCAGVLELRQDKSPVFRQANVRTAMARSAATDRGAAWVISSDADEFWVPRGRSLAAVLEAIPPRYGVVAGLWRTFVPRPADGRSFYERMTVRLSAVGAINDPTSKFRPNVKVLHRADPAVRVSGGNHGVSGHSLPPLRGWYPIEVLHFPVRSPSQMTMKWQRAREHVGSEQVGYVRRSAIADGAGGAFAELVVDDAALHEGLASGVLIEDVRVRDALRALAELPSSRFALPGNGAVPIEFGAPSVVDDALFAADVAALGEADLIRAQRRLDDLERRLLGVERNPALRVTRGLRSLARRTRARL